MQGSSEFKSCVHTRNPESLESAFGLRAVTAPPACVVQPQRPGTSTGAPACAQQQQQIDSMFAQRWGGECAPPDGKCSPALDCYYMEGRPIMNARAPHRPAQDIQPLQSVYREPPRPPQERPHSAADPPSNYFEAAFRVYDDTDTPKTLGVAPQNGRGTGAPLRIDALRPNELKPAKSQLTQSELKGSPFPDGNNFGNQSIAHVERCRAEERSKLYSGSGALNNFRPDVCNQKSGYNKGAIIQPRGGGYHPMARFMVPQEYKRERMMFGRPGAAQAATTKLPLLGQIRCNANYATNEYHRFPAPQQKRRGGYGLRPENVTMKPVQRGAEFEYGGPAGTARDAQPELRLQSLMIRPKNVQEFSYSGHRTATNAKQGAYLITQPFKRAKNEVEFAYSGQRTGDGAPGSYATTTPLKRAKNEVVFAYSGQRTGDSVGLGYLVEEHDVLPSVRDESAQSAHETGGAFRNRGQPGAELTAYDTGRAQPGLQIKEVGAGRPGGPVWASNAIGDALHPKRMNDPVLLDTQNKDTGVLSMDKRHVVPDKTYVVQYDQTFPCNRVRRVTPDIVQAIDPTLLLAYKSNPYTQPILN